VTFSPLLGLCFFILPNKLSSLIKNILCPNLDMEAGGGAADEVEAEQKAKVIKKSVDNETHPACIQI
jgi:hypothetical protein